MNSQNVIINSYEHNYDNLSILSKPLGLDKIDKFEY